LNNGFSLKLLVSFVIGVASLAFFVWWERRVANPLLDIRLFSNRTFPSALLAGFTIGLIIGGSLLPLLYFIQKIQEISLVAAFVRILPMVVAAVLFSPVAGTLVEKRGARQIIVFGLGLVAISGMIFSFMQPATPYAIILLALILLGIGNIAIVTPVTDTVLNCLPPEKSGSAAAINFDLRAVVHALAFKPFLILCESSFRKPPSMRLP
jgi:Na+/melibiose symporter-like transporter